MVVLKRLRDAQRDGDRILAVIRGSAVNQDGRSNGLTAPNGLAQQQVMLTALRCAGFPPETIGYIETHGTGTALGDPIEVAALRQVLDASGDAEDPCWLGAVKSNIGHLESAAGIASLIKAILVLRHGLIPPVAGFNKLNPYIDLAASRLRIPAELTHWPVPSTHGRRAGVSSFGIGGTNAHVVLESAPEPPPSAPPSEENHTPGSPCLFTLSANSVSSLKQLAAAYADKAQTLDEEALAPICAATWANRAQLPQRLSVAVCNTAELAAQLAAYASADTYAHPMMTTGRARQRHRVVFLFTGQGTHYAQMGLQLYRTEPVFSAYVDRCDEILSSLLERSIRDLLLDEKSAGLLDSQRHAQVAITVLELALVRLWQHHGVEPEFVIGHSVGEYAAAHIAGVMDLETTLRLVSERGRCMDSAAHAGAMLSIMVGRDDASALLASVGTDLDIAAVNAPNQIVLSGLVSEVERVSALLTQRNVPNKRLPVTLAFHSRLMEPASRMFGAIAGDAEFRPPVRKLLLTGGVTSDALLDADGWRNYWINQILQPVLFHDAIEAAVRGGADTFIEVGPMPVLSRLGARAFAQLRWFTSIEKGSAAQRFRATLGALFVQGMDVKLGEPARRNPAFALPKTVFDRASYWFTAGCGREPLALPPLGINTLVGRRLELAVPDMICFETVLPANASYLTDHRLSGKSVMPGAGYASLIAEAAAEAGLVLSDHGNLSIRELQFLRPLVLAGEGIRVQTLLRRKQDWETSGQAAERAWGAQIMAWVAATQSWELHAVADLYQFADGKADDAQWRLQQEGCDLADQSYVHWARHGLEYGPSFRAVRGVEVAAGRVRAALSLPACAGGTAERLSPILLDAAFQTLGVLLKKLSGWEGYMPLPAGIGQIDIYGTLSSELLIEAQLTSTDTAQQLTADISIFDVDGINVARIKDLRLTPVSLTSLQAVTSAVPPQHFGVEWFPAPIIDETDAGQPVRPWHVLALGEKQHAFFRLLAEQTWCEQATLDAAALKCDETQASWPHTGLHDAHGLLLWVPPLPQGQDPIGYCVTLCERLQTLLGHLHGMSNAPQGFPICLVTANAGNSQAELQNMLVRAALNAMWRSAAQEYSKFVLRHIGIGPASTEAEVKLLRSHAYGSDETELTIRHGAARIARLVPRAADGGAEAMRLRPDSSYLITGGAGGIGLALAGRLASAGAGRVVLVSRRNDPGPAVEALRKTWAARGVTVEYHSADVSQESSVAALLTQLGRHQKPLRGVFHAAAVLDDCPLSGIDHESWQRVLMAKAASACLLDRHTRSHPLDMFVLFSSVASTIGSSGQCNYAAANGVLDALAHARRRQGLCGTVINWGPWADIGLAAGRPDLAERLARAGLHHIAPFDGFNALDRVLGQARDIQTIVAAVDWSHFGHKIFGAVLPSALRNLVADSGRSTRQGSLIASAELAQMESEAATAEIRRGMCNLLRQVLRSQDIGPLADDRDAANVRLSALGIDSLMAMELRNRVKTWVNVELPTHMLIGDADLGEVAELIYEKVLLAFLNKPSAQDAEATEREEIFVL